MRNPKKGWDDMVDERELVQRIKEFRTKRGMVLEELAKKTGLSKGYLSKVENSEKSPPVSTLTKIAKALGVSMSALFGEEETVLPYHITKKDNRPLIARKGSGYGYSYESLAAGYSNRKMDPYFVEIPPNTEQPFYEHRGEEIFFVLEGKIRVVHGDIEFILEEGDCCYFDASVPHHSYAIGDHPAKALMVLYTPEEE